MKLNSLLILFVFLSLPLFAKDYRLVKGVVDLSKWKGEVITLRGEWEFYPYQFLSSGENPEERSYIKLPGKWNSFKVKGKKLGPYAYGTYRAFLDFPRRTVGEENFYHILTVFTT